MKAFDKFIFMRAPRILGMRKVFIPFSIYAGSEKIDLNENDLFKINDDGRVSITFNSRLQKKETQGFWDKLLESAPTLELIVDSITKLADKNETVLFSTRGIAS